MNHMQNYLKLIHTDGNTEIESAQAENKQLIIWLELQPIRTEKSQKSWVRLHKWFFNWNKAIS